MLHFYIQGLNTVLDLSRTSILIYLLLYFGFIIAFYVLRAIGLSTIAKKANIKHANLAWIPFAWIYVACKIVGETRLFGMSYGKLAMPCLIFFCVYGVLNLVCSFLVYYPLLMYFFQGGEIYFSMVANGYSEYAFLSDVFVQGTVANPYVNMGAVINFLNISVVFSRFFDFIEIIITVSLYINIFRKYWPRHYLLASLLSIFTGLFPVFIFVVRKNPPTKFVTVVRVPYETFNEAQKKDSGNNPFDEYPDRNIEDPFSEFSNKDKDE